MANLSVMILLAAAAGGAVLLSLLMTNPTQLGSYGVTAWFIGIFIALGNGLGVGLYALKGYLRPQDSRLDSLTASRRQGMIIGGGLTVFLALASLRQLSLRDVALISILLLLVEFYLRTRQ